MRTNGTLYQFNCPAKYAGRAWKGRKWDAGGTQVGRKAGAERRRTDASQKRPKA